MVEHINAPPGLRNAAPLIVCMVRSFHPHWPFGVKFMFACTDTQNVPEKSEHWDGRSMPNDPVSAPDAIATLLNVHTALPGKVPIL